MSQSAFEIAKILLLSNFISLDDFILTVRNIMSGSLEINMKKKGKKVKKGK